MYRCQQMPLETKPVLEAIWTSLAQLVLMVIQKCTTTSCLEMTLFWAQAVQESGSGCCQAVESSHTNARPTTLWEQQTAQLLPLLLEVNINNSCTCNVHCQYVCTIQYVHACWYPCRLCINVGFKTCQKVKNQSGVNLTETFTRLV